MHLDDNCAVCMTPLGDGPVLVLSCNHVYHDECLESQLKQGWPRASAVVRAGGGGGGSDCCSHCRCEHCGCARVPVLVYVCS